MRVMTGKLNWDEKENTWLTRMLKEKSKTCLLSGEQK